MMRTHSCGELRASDAGSEVRLAGWVHHRRDHGKIIFLDLRDASGTVQVVVHPDVGVDAESVQREYCVSIGGTVEKRKPGTENANLPTGEIEITARSLEVLSPSETPPFIVEDGVDVDDVTRLKYRYIDLRRPEMQHALRLRAKVVGEIRSYLDARGFTEIETPILFKSTPEGARDFLVPSRLQRGSFYALPQSPQMLKQILMVGGMERYYQIARCFRDEDLRADRQLEHTQLDLEMSFVEQEDVLQLLEGLFIHLWRECVGVDVEQPFPRIPYAEAIRRFGTDHVDLRYGMELADLNEVFSETSLGIFRSVITSGGTIRGFAVPGAGELNHAQLKRLEHAAMDRGAKGLAWVILRDGGEVDSPLAKHLSERERNGIASATDGKPGDLILMMADKAEVVNPILGALRMELAKERGLIPDGAWKFCWIVDYPFFVWNPDEDKWDPIHHPFTMPVGGGETLDGDPAAVRASAYDLVLNGLELLSGSIRIHRPDIQRKVFDALGISPEDAEERFGFFLEAFRYGPPPHGGIGCGIDRVMMQMLGTENIRDVVAFPKTQSGVDPLSGAPTPVDPDQLKILGLRPLPS
ncbi:MAG: aspartate--tRNA ligase [Actinobacteria bacterium]|nr:MAG: aspartate--tRNA ligase [Actinomycetota bacterium]